MITLFKKILIMYKITSTDTKNIIKFHHKLNILSIFSIIILMIFPEKWFIKIVQYININLQFIGVNLTLTISNKLIEFQQLMSDNFYLMILIILGLIVFTISDIINDIFIKYIELKINKLNT